MEEALVTKLLASSGVTSLVSTRIWWGRAPQTNSALPYVVLTRITGQRDYHMQGPSGYVGSRVQADIYAETYASAKTAARAIVAAISGFSGAQSGVAFQGIFLDSERDLPASDAGGVDQIHRVSLDFFIHHG